ncbi:hypothetical protein KHC33_12135 [Methanospirillum sp. J.3.6.1-F.2.7.3]|uniref:Uncharacterized protein n=1 Tax=Methanospirillum purgamenti TaxID=2834276 RepID=A0A8E7EIG9_9EURY|nr:MULTISPECIES: hypothetical protein [Methanospirillum]MDX8550383.1 hypothetical protein [Methanospirillum hungatei]QVV88079.1 hypothetical protein KHC33_12135 [Methanospirillum sp. J.3.6.1-F.2.7.3]
MNPRYSAYTVYLELPKRRKARKCVTSRIVTINDIKEMINRINTEERTGEISPERAIQYRAVIIMGAYTGQRIEATMSKLTVGEVRKAMEMDKPCLSVPSDKDKIKMAHYVPFHPNTIGPLRSLIEGRDDDELLFSYHSINMWIKHKKFPLSRCEHHFVLGDLRKFAEQHGDAICWNDSNRSYILTHGVSGVQWAHYKSPLPEYVYDVYMQAWKEILIE